MRSMVEGYAPNRHPSVSAARRHLPLQGRND